MKILVTGAAGFIGTNLTIKLAENKDNQITLVDRSKSYFSNIEKFNFSNVEIRESSLDMDMNPVVYEGEGLRARAILHEMDHLDGVLYGERASEPYRDLDEEEDWEE